MGRTFKRITGDYDVPSGKVAKVIVNEFTYKDGYPRVGDADPIILAASNFWGLGSQGSSYNDNYISDTSLKASWWSGVVQVSEVYGLIRESILVPGQSVRVGTSSISCTVIEEDATTL